MLHWYYVLVIIIGTLGLIVSGILYFANKNESFSARILALFLFCLSQIGVNHALFQTNFYLDHPHWWRFSMPATLLLPVLGLLYVRAVLEQQFRLRRTDYLLLIPAVFYCFNYLGFYLRPASEKLVLIRESIADKTLISQEPEGLLPPGWGIIFRLLFGLSLTAAQVWLLLRWRKRIYDTRQTSAQNQTTFQWLAFFTTMVGSAYLLMLVWQIFQLSHWFDLYDLMAATVSFCVMSICGYLLVKPEILYGLTGWLQQESPVPLVDNSEKATKALVPAGNTLSRAQEQTYQEMLEIHFLTRHPYLKAGYKISDLSRELDVPTYMLSPFINQKYGKNFNELVNDYRVEYMNRMLQDQPDAYRYTLEALSRQVGFNSRSAFITAVKKKTGKTPSEYFSRLTEGVRA